jgi:ABC-type Fe3+/spermidine/putrescine transport system ATPase subunit
VGAVQGRTVSQLLTISGLRVRYGSLMAIDDLDLFVPPGEFLGAANILPISVSDGRAKLACGLVVQAAMNVPADARWLAVRPERVTVGEVDAANRLAGIVVQRSYAGETLTHVVRLEDGTLMRATTVLQQGLAGEPVAVGDSVTLSWQPNASILLRQ